MSIQKAPLYIRVAKFRYSFLENICIRQHVIIVNSQNKILDISTFIVCFFDKMSSPQSPQDGTKYLTLISKIQCWQSLLRLNYLGLESALITFCMKCKYIGINVLINRALVARAKYMQREREEASFGANVSCQKFVYEP